MARTINADNVDRMARAIAAKLNPETTWFETFWQITNEMPVKRAALKNWLKVGDRIETMQITVSWPYDADDPSVVSAWGPGPRTVAHIQSNAFQWDTDSWGDFHRCYTADDSLWIGAYEWGRDQYVIVVHRRVTD